MAGETAPKVGNQYLTQQTKMLSKAIFAKNEFTFDSDTWNTGLGPYLIHKNCKQKKLNVPEVRLSQFSFLLIHIWVQNWSI